MAELVDYPLAALDHQAARAPQTPSKRFAGRLVFGHGKGRACSTWTGKPQPSARTNTPRYIRSVPKILGQPDDLKAPPSLEVWSAAFSPNPTAALALASSRPQAALTLHFLACPFPQFARCAKARPRPRHLLRRRFRSAKLSSVLRHALSVRGEGARENCASISIYQHCQRPSWGRAATTTASRERAQPS